MARARRLRTRTSFQVDLDDLPPDLRPTASVTAEEIRARVLYRDAWVIVIDKPQGLPVHAGPTSPDHLERYLGSLAFGYAAPPQLAHRLDRDTSGCLVLGRHRRALRRLGGLFEAGRVTKTYWAVVAGVPDRDRGTIDLPLAKVTAPRGWRMVTDANGRPARTDWTLMASDGQRSWLELRPHTGRTHQLRIHTAALGLPIEGDGFYGEASSRNGPLLLHARSLTLPLYSAAPPVHVEAAPPAPLAASIERLLAAAVTSPDRERP